MQRPSNRQPNEMRPVRFISEFTKHAEGSVLVAFGETKVICNATVEKKVPAFLKGQAQGWITAEYGMLPRSTHSRMRRESSAGKQGGRTLEIQRLIGRSLRAAVDLKKMPELTITIDCDVIQADGGTRTASITGGFVALAMAVEHCLAEGFLEESPILYPVGSVSVGIFEGTPVLDLDYAEDANAETDMNLVMTEDKRFIEIQGTAEATPFSREEMDAMLALGEKGIGELIAAQKQVLAQWQQTKDIV